MLVSCSVHQGWNFLSFKEFIERKNKSTCDEKLIALFCQNDKSSFSAFFCMTVVNLSLWCVYFLYHSCRQSQLHYHNARQHDGHRPYPCTAAGCERKFYKKSDLKTHAKLHLGVKDHPCPICQRKFSHVSNLNRHLLTHKKAIIARPFLCPRHRLIYEYICRKNPTLAIFVVWDTIRLLPWISIWKSTMFPNPHLATFTVTFAAWDFHIKQIWTYIKSRNMRHSLNPMSADGANEDLQDSPESQDTTASY